MYSLPRFPYGKVLRMPKILLVDDDLIVLRLLQPALEQREFQVVTSRSGIDALRLTYWERPDIILLDINLPDLNGIEVCQRLRQITDASVIILSAETQEKTIVDALESGANDYVSKPYSVDELVARIQAQLRIYAYRNQASDTEEKSVFTAGQVRIDTKRRQVYIRDAEVDLTPTEYKLLLYLVNNPGRVVSHQELLAEAWGPEYIDQLDYLRLYVRYLRQKIEVDPTRPQIIRTERGIGYSLQDS
jgi:two-component system, OmpR family, KDP operon response regulator KdpE